MNCVIDQPELSLTRAPNHADIPVTIIRAKKNSGSAFGLACDASGLDDKEIYLSLGIDAGYFSNIKKSKATLQGDLVKDFCSIVGNSIYLEWMAYQIGCTLVMIKSEAERRLEKAEAELRQVRHDYEMKIAGIREARAAA
jgi:hypothetical protein